MSTWLFVCIVTDVGCSFSVKAIKLMGARNKGIHLPAGTPVQTKPAGDGILTTHVVGNVFLQSFFLNTRLVRAWVII